MLTYIETLYENKNVVSTNQIDENTFALLLMISASAKNIRELDDIVDEDPYLSGCFTTDRIGNCSGMRAFLEMITAGRDNRWRGREDSGQKERAKHVAKIIDDLETKGYYVGMWEEGNVAIACEGFEDVAREAVFKKEMFSFTYKHVVQFTVYALDEAGARERLQRKINETNRSSVFREGVVNIPYDQRLYEVVRNRVR